MKRRVNPSYASGSAESTGASQRSANEFRYGLGAHRGVRAGPITVGEDCGVPGPSANLD